MIAPLSGKTLNSTPVSSCHLIVFHTFDFEFFHTRPSLTKKFATAIEKVSNTENVHAKDLEKATAKATAVVALDFKINNMALWVVAYRFQNRNMLTVLPF